MATKYFPSESGSSNVRGILTYSTVQTDTQVTLTISAVLQANGVYGSGYECILKLDNVTVKDELGHKDPPAAAGWTTFLQTGDYSKTYSRGNSDATVTIAASFAGKADGGWNPGAGSGSTTVQITIPKKDAPTASQSLSSKTGSTATIAWSSNKTIDYIWYSKDNGSTWTAVGSVNASSGTYTITGLSPNTTYQIKTRVRASDTQLTANSTALSVTTYAAPTATQTFDVVTDTTINISWSSNATIDYVWYSKDNGTSWTAVGSVNASSGSYTITGLTAGTTYKIKTRLRGKNAQLTTDSAALSITTLGYPSVTQSLSSKTATSVTIAWSSDSACDFVWYSTNNGTSWTAVGSVNALSGSYTISGLSQNTTYQIKTRLRRTDSQLTKDSSALSVTTYAYPSVSQSLASKTGSSITMNWSSNSTCDYVWYSKDNGSTWMAVGAVSATSGSYTITGLSANTAYQIKTRLRRKDSQLTADSSALSVTTYAAPTVSQSLSAKTDTTIKISWSSDSTIDFVWYSKNGGTSWIEVGEVNSRSGSYTISGLKADTIYSIETRVRGKNAQLRTVSSALSVKTYAYPTISQSLDYKTTNTIVIDWISDSICDYVWYSKNNGSTWTAVGATEAELGYYTITGLSEDTTYQIKTKVRRKDSQYTSESSTLTVTTYGYPTVSQTLSSKTETTVAIAWSSDNICDYLWYSTNNGTSWSGINIADGSSGTYTITGLSANTAYQIKTRLRRKDSQLTKDSSALSVTTYNYPYAKTMPNFTIGNNLKITLYNPLGRSVSLTIIAADGSTKSGGTVSGVTSEGYTSNAWKTFFYASIPNAKNGTYQVKVSYGNVDMQNTGGKYSINTSECTPEIGSVTYKDTNTTTKAVTGNDQKIVQNLSTVRYTASGLSAKNSASIASVQLAVNGLTYNLTVSGSSATGGNATIDSITSVTARATITDSRGLTASKSVTVSVLAWSLPSAIISLYRESNYYDTTYLKADAIYSSVDNHNTISISYSGSAVPQTGKPTPSGVSGTLQDNQQITLTLSNAFVWNFTITLTDVFGTKTYSVKLPRGTPIIFFDDTLQSASVNKFPKHENSFEADEVYYKDIDLSIMTYQSTGRADIESGAAWYRIARYDAANTSIATGTRGALFDIAVSTAYLNSIPNCFKKIAFLCVSGRRKFVNETSAGNTNAISKIRYVTDTSGYGYIDVYIDVSAAVYAFADLITRSAFNYKLVPVAFEKITSLSAEYTVQATFDFHQNFSYEDDAFYKAGDTFSVSETLPLPGVVSNSAKTIYLQVTLPKRLDNISTIAISTLKGRMVGINGTVDSSTLTTDWTSGYTATAFKVSENIIGISIVKSSAFGNCTTATPANLLLGSLTLAFS